MTDGEYDELHQLDVDYARAVDYLSRLELRLAPPREALTARDEQVIMWVASERQRLSRAGADALNPIRQAFEEEAEPQELDMTDADLVEVLNARGRRRGR